MIYLDHGATSYPKPWQVRQAVRWAMERAANPGRSAHALSENAARTVYDCREQAAELFGCAPEQVVMTSGCTHGLNIAIRSLVKPGDRVVISGFEHNAVTRPLRLVGAEVAVAGRRLFDWEDTLTRFEEELKRGAAAAVFTHVSNVFGYILPVEEIAGLCRKYGVPMILDAAQSAGSLEVKLGHLGADFIAMPGHKGLLGPMGTGLLLCAGDAQPLMAGGTGNNSLEQWMPEALPERLEAGTVNVPGIAGLAAGLRFVRRVGTENIFRREHLCAAQCAARLREMGHRVFAGAHQAGTVSFAVEDSEETARRLAERGIAVRGGLHCAPLAHESAGTLQTGTVRVSFGHDAHPGQVDALMQSLRGNF